MMEQPYTGKCHGHAVLIAGCDHLVIPDGTAWLSHIFNTTSVGSFDIVSKWKEGIRTKSHVFQPIQPCSFLFPRKNFRASFENIFPLSIGQHIHVFIANV